MFRNIAVIDASIVPKHPNIQGCSGTLWVTAKFHNIYPDLVSLHLVPMSSRVLHTREPCQVRLARFINDNNVNLQQSQRKVKMLMVAMSLARSSSGL